MLPTFVIIGAMKSGTTSLHRYLDLHPEVCMSSIKETDFFIAERNYSRGLAWYESLFPRKARQYGEASPNYTKAQHFGDVPRRMHAAIPDCKLIYVLRDPLARMISQYAHSYAKGKESRPLAQALTRPWNPYLPTSRYHTQLKGFLEFYPLDRVLVLTAEELRNNRRVALRRVYEFLGVDAGFDCPDIDEEYYVTADRYTITFSLEKLLPNQRLLYFVNKLIPCPFTRPSRPSLELDETTRNRLKEALLPEVDALRRLTGQSFSQWSL